MKQPGRSKTSLLLAGGVAAGGAAVLCCLGPLLAAGLGLGSFAAAAWFAQWRPVFLGLTLVLLALAGYLTYRRPKADGAAGACARPPARAARLSLWAGALLALGAAVYPSLAGSRAAINPALIAAGDARLSVRVPSMDCAACARGIEASLARAPGVKQAAVDYDTRTAELVYDPAATSRDQLLTLIDATGFPAERATLK